MNTGIPCGIQQMCVDSMNGWTWVDGWIDGWMGRQVDGGINEWVDRQTDGEKTGKDRGRKRRKGRKREEEIGGWKDRWINDWMDAQIDGWMPHKPNFVIKSYIYNWFQLVTWLATEP